MEAFDVLYKLKLKPIIQILSPNYPSAPCRAPPKMYTQTRTRTHTHTEENQKAEQQQQQQLQQQSETLHEHVLSTAEWVRFAIYIL